MRCALKRAAVLSIGVAVVTLAVAVMVEAQQPKKVPRIGFIRPGPPQDPNVEAFRQGLRELGYIEGQNIVIEDRAAEGKLDRLPALAAELVGLKIDVIVVGGTSAIHPVREATHTIPIVMASAGDPVTDGFVASLARPAGNITGLSTMHPELSGKRLELINETVSKSSRFAILWDPSDPGATSMFRETGVAAHALGVQLQSLEVRRPDDFENAFRAAGKGRAQ